MKKTAIFDEFNGLIAKQFVLQRMADPQLFFWTSGATAEVDFATQTGDKILPIEVKSGENIHAKSLKMYREKYQPAISLRFSLRGREFNNGLLNLPLHEIFLLNQLLELYAFKAVSNCHGSS